MAEKGGQLQAAIIEALYEDLSATDPGEFASPAAIQLTVRKGRIKIKGNKEARVWRVIVGHGAHADKI